MDWADGDSVPGWAWVIALILWGPFLLYSAFRGIRRGLKWARTPRRAVVRFWLWLLTPKGLLFVAAMAIGYGFMAHATGRWVLTGGGLLYAMALGGLFGLPIVIVIVGVAGEIRKLSRWAEARIAVHRLDDPLDD